MLGSNFWIWLHDKLHGKIKPYGRLHTLIIVKISRNLDSELEKKVNAHDKILR